MNNIESLEFLHLHKKFGGFKTKLKTKIDIDSINKNLVSHKKFEVDNGLFIATSKNAQKTIKITNKRKQVSANIVEAQINTISKNMQNYDPCTETLKNEKKQMYIDARKQARKKLK